MNKILSLILCFFVVGLFAITNSQAQLKPKVAIEIQTQQFDTEICESLVEVVTQSGYDLTNLEEAQYLIKAKLVSASEVNNTVEVSFYILIIDKTTKGEPIVFTSLTSKVLIDTPLEEAVKEITKETFLNIRRSNSNSQSKLSSINMNSI